MINKTEKIGDILPGVIKEIRSNSVKFKKNESPMILLFQNIFKHLILSKRKVHTFRKDKRNRWKPGTKILFSTGVNESKYSCFKIGVCTSTQEAQIKYHQTDDYPAVILDGLLLNHQQVEIIARNDGFETVDDFFKWFNKDFSGKLVHWTDLKY